MTEKSFLQRNPTLRWIVVGACALIAVAVLSRIFGPDFVKDQIDRGLCVALQDCTTEEVK